MSLLQSTYEAIMIYSIMGSNHKGALMKLLVTFLAATLLSFSALAEIDGPALNYLDLEKMARVAINDEVTVLNKVIKNYLTEQEDFDLHGYKKRDLSIFKKFNRSEERRVGKECV